MKPIVKVS